jgi:hypothetical protein
MFQIIQKSFEKNKYIKCSEKKGIRGSEGHRTTVERNILESGFLSRSEEAN